MYQAAEIEFGDRPKKYKKGRVCRKCGSLLSRYNRGPYCWHHPESQKYKAVRRGTPAGRQIEQ
jgi:hypothetical protein